MKFLNNQNLKILKLDKIQIFLFVILFIIGATLIFEKNLRPGEQNNHEKTASADTYIPKGYTLVPIELQNTDSISSIVEEFAIVDLYTHSLTEKRARKIGSRLRLLRAPLNPERFAVLVPDSQAGLILGANSPISASILNRQQIGQGIVETDIKPTKLKVQYYQGDI